MAKRTLQKDSFTLIELMVVITILVILVALLLPMLASARAKAKEILCLNNQKQIYLASILYTEEHDGYLRKGWSEIGIEEGLRYFTLHYFGGKDVLDPITVCPSGVDGPRFVNQRWGSCCGGGSQWRYFYGYCSDERIVGKHNAKWVKLQQHPPTRGFWFEKYDGQKYQPISWGEHQENHIRGVNDWWNVSQMYNTIVLYQWLRTRHLKVGERMNVSFIDGHVKGVPFGTLAAAHSYGPKWFDYLE